jgi:type IV pilus assembly protein PilW
MRKLGLRSRARGLSLVELMISLVIGLVVVGAVIVSIISSSNAGRYQSAFAQMNEDAQIALSILRRDLEMAGYSVPTALSPDPLDPTKLIFTFGTMAGNNGRWVFGCDKGFVSTTAAVGALACNPATDPDNFMFEVAYEADGSNTVLAGGFATNCLGNSVGGAGPRLAINRYFVSTELSGRPELRCSSNGQTQPLVENIESMKVWYGVAVNNTSSQVVRYVTAASIGATQWDQVVSARVCILVRSAEPVLLAGEDDQAGSLLTQYSDCDRATQTTTDRRLRRAYFATAALRTKMPE